VNGRVDGVEKALIRIRSEVDGNARAGCDGTGHLDIECDFSVGTVWIPGWSILRAVYGNGGGRDVVQSELIPVSLEIGVVEASAEFDQGDGLVFARVRREIVDLRELPRRVGERFRRAGMNAVVGNGDRTPVKAEDSDDRSL